MPSTESGESFDYDVFLSHASADKAVVEEIAHRLLQESVRPFLDKWHLVPGDVWVEGLEEGLDASRTFAVFVGPNGIAPWQNEEMGSALGRPSARPIAASDPGAAPRRLATGEPRPPPLPPPGHLGRPERRPRRRRLSPASLRHPGAPARAAGGASEARRVPTQRAPPARQGLPPRRRQRAGPRARLRGRLRGDRQALGHRR